MPAILGIGFILAGVGIFLLLRRGGQNHIGGGPIPKRDQVYEEE